MSENFKINFAKIDKIIFYDNKKFVEFFMGNKVFLENFNDKDKYDFFKEKIKSNFSDLKNDKRIFTYFHI